MASKHVMTRSVKADPTNEDSQDAIISDTRGTILFSVLWLSSLIDVAVATTLKSRRQAQKNIAIDLRVELDWPGWPTVHRIHTILFVMI